MEDVSKTCVASVIVVPLASREEKEEFYHIKSWSEFRWVVLVFLVDIAFTFFPVQAHLSTSERLTNVQVIEVQLRFWTTAKEHICGG